MIFLVFMVRMRDNLKFGCYPIVIANIIFAFMLLILSQILIIYSLIYSEDILLKACHLAIYGIFGISLLNNAIYRSRYAKYDIAKEDEELENNLAASAR